MIVINSSNIDEVLFDYFEGNLSSEDKNNVSAFINANPQFQADFDAWNSTILTSQNWSYPEENKLLRKHSFSPLKWWILNSFLLVILGAGITQFYSANTEVNYTPRNLKNQVAVFETTVVKTSNEYQTITNSTSKKKPSAQLPVKNLVYPSSNSVTTEKINDSNPTIPIDTESVNYRDLQLIASIKPLPGLSVKKELKVLDKRKRKSQENNIKRKRHKITRVIQSIKAWENRMRIKRMNNAKKVTQKTKMVPMNEGF